MYLLVWMHKLQSKIKTQRVNTRFLCLVALVGATLVVGCSGQLSQDAIKRRGITRSRAGDDDEDERRRAARKKQANGEAPTNNKFLQDAPVDIELASATPEQQTTAPKGPSEVKSQETDSPIEKVGRLPPIPADLTAEQRQLRSAENLERIAAAIDAYFKEKKTFPAQGHPRMSWRVALLPFLGYQDLYEEYNQDEPWFAEANRSLLSRIPTEYQSPERRDSMTNYQLVVGKYAAYTLARKVPRETKYVVQNGNVILIEVKDELAVNWTEPKDCDYVRNKGGGLPLLRDGEFLAMTSDRKVFSISPQKVYQNRAVRKLTPLYEYDEDREERVPKAAEKVGRAVADLKFAVKFSQQSTTSSAEVGAVSVGDASEGASSNSRVVESGSSLQRSQLSVDSWRAAELSAQVGMLKDGWRWARGAVAAGLPLSRWQKFYQWVPALRRPALGVQVAVALPGRPGQSYQDQAAARIQFANAAGPAGGALLRELEISAKQLLLAPLTITVDRTRGQKQQRGSQPLEETSSLTFVVDAPTVNEAIEIARGLEVDVLVYFDPNVVGRDRGLEYEVEVYDIFRSKRLLKTDRVLVQARGVSNERLRDNYNELAWELTDFIKDSLTPTSWPVQITPDLASKRVSKLKGDVAQTMPLTVMNELQYYRQKGLIDEAELLDAYENVLGRDDARSILLGSQEKQRRVARKWLPASDPQEFIAAAEARALRQARADDDD